MKNSIVSLLKKVRKNVSIWREKIDRINGWKSTTKPLFSPAERVLFAKRIKNAQDETLRQKSMQELGIKVRFSNRSKRSKSVV